MSAVIHSRERIATFFSDRPFTMRKRKQQRKSHTSSVNNEENVVVMADDVVIGGEDRLSDLPECLLTEILSRLPTRDAVRTCVLSKQWEKKWTSIYSMEFNDIHSRGRGQTRKERFSNFVDRVLMHCPSPSLQSFHLSCSSSPTVTYDSDRISAWISTALRRNAQFLLIDTCSESTLLPPGTYCNSPKNGLKELIILSALTVRVPDDALFSTLTKINFNHVVLLGNSNDDEDDTGGGGGGSDDGPAAEDGGGQLVVLKLPFLKYLSMFYCEWRNVNAVKFEVPMLQSFNMTMRTLNFMFKELLEGFVFTVCGGSNLTDITLSGNLSESYDILPSSQVKNASIELTSFPLNWNDTGIRISTTLKRMTTLVFLELSGESLTALSHAAKHGHCLPFFGSLIHMKLRLTDIWCEDSAAVISIIKQAPILETLTLETFAEVGKDLRYNERTNAERDGIIPDCFHSHLKVVKFISAINCMRKEKDTSLIKFILENNSALEQLQFINPPKRRSIPFSKIRKLLLSFPRASSAAQIMFI